VLYCRKRGPPKKLTIKGGKNKARGEVTGRFDETEKVRQADHNHRQRKTPKMVVRKKSKGGEKVMGIGRTWRDQ